MSCTLGCRCRCEQTTCGCKTAVGMTDASCAYGSAGIRCRLCNGPARVQRIESVLQGRRIGVVWCPTCDEPSQVVAS